MTILITGVAGFIGFSVASKLLADGKNIIGIDSLNQYYDVALKKQRIKLLQAYPSFTFYVLDITHRENIKQFFDEHNIEVVIHLAAQPGVRYSITHPEAYIDTNLVGFGNILEACRQHEIKHFTFVSM